MVREYLSGDGLTSFAKTSGSKGMQVYASITPATDRRTSDYAHDMAKTLEKAHPKLVLSRMAKNLRGGKVFVDWSQNNGAKTTVAPYSLRAREQPWVSTPLTWDEVAAAKRPTDLQFVSGDVLDRVASEGDLFAGLLEPGRACRRGACRSVALRMIHCDVSRAIRDFHAIRHSSGFSVRKSAVDPAGPYAGWGHGDLRPVWEDRGRAAADLVDVGGARRDPGLLRAVQPGQRARHREQARPGLVVSAAQPPAASAFALWPATSALATPAPKRPVEPDDHAGWSPTPKSGSQCSSSVRHEASARSWQSTPMVPIVTRWISR